MYKFNRNNFRETTLDSAATEEDRYSITLPIIEALFESAPNFTFDETVDFATRVAMKDAEGLDGDVDAELDASTDATGDELTVWLSFWVCNNDTGDNDHLLEATMCWDADDYPTNKQEGRAIMEAYLYFAPIFNEQLDQMRALLR